MTRAVLTREQLIALAERTIAGCLTDVDQLDLVHERVLSDPAAIVFTVYTTRERAYALAGYIADHLTAEVLTPWTRVWPTADGCRVEIRVPVGAP